MNYIMFILLVGLVMGFIAVAANPSPYFGALGLVVVSGMGCGVLVMHGGPFLSLVLFLIYLGGMLVVFAYSAALSAEPYPKSWGDGDVRLNMAVYSVLVLGWAYVLMESWYEYSWVPAGELVEVSVCRGDTEGVAVMYSSGAEMLIITAWVLLLTLFVVLEVTRGSSRGVLRAV